MKNTKQQRFAFLTLGTAAVFAFASCKEKGPAEKAGEKVDEAIEEAEDELDDATTE